jgi:hypothetical protein
MFQASEFARIDPGEEWTINSMTYNLAQNKSDG